VSCTSGEFVECEGDRAVLCNAQGTNYDVVECQLGCDAATMSCRNCETNAECDNPTPVCDIEQNMCRGCASDGECSSQVCDANTGACLSESAVVYASPSGVDSGPCTQNAPCVASRAITIATSAAVPPVVRLLAGVYPNSLLVNADASIEIVGTGAQLGIQPDNPPHPLVVRGGARVVARDMMLAGVAACGDPLLGSPAEPISALTLSGVEAHGVRIYRCNANFKQSSFGPSRLYDDGKVVADRVEFRGTVDLAGKRGELSVTNSLFAPNGGHSVLFYNVNESSKYHFAYNTFYNPYVYLYCGNFGTEVHEIIIENNVIVSPGQTNSVQGTGCDSITNNILFPQAEARPGNLVTDPSFENPASDFRLKPGSPAIDQGMLLVIPASDHDLAGNSRPYGAQPDLGAYEWRP
jgi:hypothetical protein